MRQLLGAVSVFAMIGAGYNAIAGEYGLAWREISLVLTMAVELMGLLAGLSLLNQKFRRGRTYSPPDTNPTASSEELFAHGASDDAGAVEKEQETAERSETEPENGKTLAKWLPHPDDPAPAGASQLPEEEGSYPHRAVSSTDLSSNPTPVTLSTDQRVVIRSRTELHLPI